MLTKKQATYKKYKKYRSIFNKKPREKFITFIFGAHRSGTNMLAEAFDKSFSIDVYHEEDDAAFDDYRVKKPKEIESVIDNSWAEHIIFKPICDSQNAIKLLNNTKSSGAIWIYRDWTDVVNSAVKKFSNGFQELKSILDCNDRGGWRGENISKENLIMVSNLVEREASDATSRAAFWFLRNSLYFQQNLNQLSNVKLLRYEELVCDPSHVLRDVFHFCKIPWKNEYSKFIHKRSLQKDNPPLVDEDVKIICDDLLKKMVSLS